MTLLGSYGLLKMTELYQEKFGFIQKILAQFEGMKYFSICHKKDIADIFSTLMTVLYGKGQLPRCKRTPLFIKSLLSAFLLKRKKSSHLLDILFLHQIEGTE